MKRTSFQDMPCPVAQALEVIGDSWNVLILREAFYGASRFDDFARTLGIPTNTLTRRLKDLVAGGLLERHPYSEKPTRYEYLLSEKARELRPLMLVLLEWGNRHGNLSQRRTMLVDSLTGRPVDLVLIDRVTGLPVSSRHRVLRQRRDEATPVSYAFPEPQAEPS
ncbi:helix-turn-helix domain-containing protein [Pseudomonas sp. BN515]|uniref:winged helix-turn-helix transcriptional regulator n=1 Tax=Pseudomonas sp. BN515 TaxID=2567892 RepID=UPI002457F8B8|nr:helix-turn-helix domain-containing protein [Pseudomonas sp. BN515]MDH4873978.1 helix-turn-helix transcriptional regulator [Pseudomonas sp. BN515]